VTRRALLALAAVAAIPAALLIAFVPRGGGMPVPKRLGVSVTPLDARFGDKVTARVETPFDAAKAHVTARFAPFTVIAKRRERHAYVFTLQCLTARCLTYGSKVDFRFAPVVVSYRGKTRLLAWPIMTAGSRLTRRDVQTPRLRPTKLKPPKPSFGVQPDLLGWSMLAVATMLVVGTGGWGTRQLSRRRPQLALADAPRPLDRDVTALQLALEHVAQALPLDPPARRKALDELAAALEDLGSGLAAQVRWLAWSEAAPERWTMKELADRAAREAA
jgi:hypothetical protein